MAEKRSTLLYKKTIKYGIGLAICLGICVVGIGYLIVSSVSPNTQDTRAEQAETNVGAADITGSTPVPSATLITDKPILTLAPESPEPADEAAAFESLNNEDMLQTDPEATDSTDNPHEEE